MGIVVHHVSLTFNCESNSPLTLVLPFLSFSLDPRYLDYHLPQPSQSLSANMSDDPTFAPPPIPAAEPSALKSLLNPVQSGAATPSSVIVEPPRSPQPPPQTIVPSIPPTPLNGANPMEEVAVPPPAPMVDAAQVASATSLPPLPTDASVPPSPKPADEPPPTLPPDAIPPAVSTPSVITQETAATPFESTPQPPAIPDATPPPPPPATELAATEPAPLVSPQPPVAEIPTPAEATPAVEPSPITAPTPVVETASAIHPAVTAPPGIVEPAPTPVESTSAAPIIPTETQPAPTAAMPAPVESAPEPMQVDEPVPSPSNGLKRSGEELEGGDEKRVKEESAAPASSVPSATPQASVTEPAPTPVPVPESAPAPPTTEAPAAAPAPALPTGAGTIPLEIPPEPQPEGPTTPLTLPQRGHLQNAIKNMKKSKDSAAFLAPVDYVRFGLPHYPQYITKPMDLGTVETKLYVSDPRGPPKDKSKMGKWDESKGKYNNVAEVVLDVRQIWWNTARFNGADSPFTQSAYRLDNIFNKALRSLPADVS